MYLAGESGLDKLVAKMMVRRKKLSRDRTLDIA